MTQHIALYGKGGVGKSTILANVAAALAEDNHRVLLLGCDPKGDTGRLLHGREAPPVLSDLLACGTAISHVDRLTRGFLGVATLEIGTACGSGSNFFAVVARGLRQVEELEVIDKLQPAYVLYDFPEGAGGAETFKPLGGSMLHRAFVVTSADLSALHAANELIARGGQMPGVSRAGCSIIANNLNGSFEESIVCDFARQLETRIVGAIPRSLLVRQCEYYGKTIIELAPLSNLAYHVRRLGRQFIAAETAIPLAGAHTMSADGFRAWAHAWGDRIGEMEFGFNHDGGGI